MPPCLQARAHFNAKSPVHAALTETTTMRHHTQAFDCIFDCTHSRVPRTFHPRCSRCPCSAGKHASLGMQPASGSRRHCNSTTLCADARAPSTLYHAGVLSLPLPSAGSPAKKNPLGQSTARCGRYRRHSHATVLRDAQALIAQQLTRLLVLPVLAPL